MILIEFDQAKNRQNIEERGLPFERVTLFEWQTAIVSPDDRNNYGERRFTALGYMTGRLHVIVYTEREERRRIISFRKANKRECTIYEKAKATRSLSDR
jgi:uncharacterized DUF497 family protein